MYSILLWRMRISQIWTFLRNRFDFFPLLRSFPFSSAFLFSLPSTLYILSSGLNSFDLYQRKTLERRPWSSTGILACFTSNLYQTLITFFDKRCQKTVDIQNGQSCGKIYPTCITCILQNLLTYKLMMSQVVEWPFLQIPEKSGFSIRVMVVAIVVIMLRAHCCGQKCFPVCLRTQHLSWTQNLYPKRDTKMFSDFFQKHFVSATNVSPVCSAKKTKWATMCPPQCFSFATTLGCIHTWWFYIVEYPPLPPIHHTRVIDFQNVTSLVSFLNYRKKEISSRRKKELLANWWSLNTNF